MSNKQTLIDTKSLKIVQTLVHILGFAQFSYSVYFDWNYVRIPTELSIGSPWGGKFKFLTFWDAILQAVYFGICLIDDLTCTRSTDYTQKKPFIQRVRDYLLTSIAFPVAMFVGLTFWGLMAIDRELVFPKAIDPYFPGWLNHVMHTNVMIFTLLELITSFRRYPQRSVGLTGLALFMGSYLVWCHVIFFNSGLWVYPVLDVLNWWQRIIFFAVMLLFGAMLYVVGELLNNAFWSKELKQKDKHSAKQARRKTK